MQRVFHGIDLRLTGLVVGRQSIFFILLFPDASFYCSSCLHKDEIIFVRDVYFALTSVNFKFDSLCVYELLKIVEFIEPQWV